MIKGKNMNDWKDIANFTIVSLLKLRVNIYTY